jgi:NAD(P)-dependent dehydrogenase (short-subunit alcohol dehydrogenase family)
VVIADIQDDEGARLAAELGRSATFIHTDVRREADVLAAVNHAVTTYGRLDCLFNNAGMIVASGGIEAIRVEDFEQDVAVLLLGVLLGMKHATPVMKRQGSGSIINTASIAGLYPGWSAHVYSATKAAVIQLTRTVAQELGEHGIRVNCICPGAIATPIFGRIYGLDQREALKSVGRLTALSATGSALKRWGVPDDIAHAALWLASDDSSFVTGHTLVVDGGVPGGLTWTQKSDVLGTIHDAVVGETEMT